MVRRADGGVFQARVTCTVLPEGAGGVVSFSDLTEKLESDRKLLEAMRTAGMAEVATGVLHNVGNVLNSVNVAACVVASKLKASEIPNLVRAGDMMQEHREQLPTYLSEDERGKHLPDFLIEVSRTLGAEQKAMLDELDAVTKGIEHVKHVVNLQQQHAKKTAIAEPINPSEVMESAVQLQIDSLNRHGVVVERRFENMPSVTADKHLVLQILVNLIANARHAMQHLAPGQRRLTLVAKALGEGDARSLALEVIDNGVGIPAENLSRIFGQGFTTKKDGHGFGLHSAANAATQMGGSLSATSDGPGTGARFVLMIPMFTGAAHPAASR
jgi:signal transduction histidine kinase